MMAMNTSWRGLMMSLGARGPAVALGGAGPRLGRLDLAVARRGGGLQRLDQLARHPERVLHGPVERRLVGLRRLREAAQLAHELQRGGADLLVGGGRIEVEQGLDAPAHGREAYE